MKKQLKKAEFTDGSVYETKNFSYFVSNQLLGSWDNAMEYARWCEQFKGTIDSTLESIGDYVETYAKEKYSLEASRSGKKFIDDFCDQDLLDELKSRGVLPNESETIISEGLSDRFLKVIQLGNHIEIEAIINELEVSLKIR